MISPFGVFLNRCPLSGWPWKVFSTEGFLTKVMFGALVSISNEGRLSITIEAIPWLSYFIQLT